MYFFKICVRLSESHFEADSLYSANDGMDSVQTNKNAQTRKNNFWSLYQFFMS